MNNKLIKMNNTNKNSNVLKVPKEKELVECLDSRMETTDSSAKEESSSRKARKRTHSDSSPSSEDRAWMDLFENTETDFATVAKLKEKFDEHVDIDAVKRISKQLATDLHMQFDSLAKLANRLIVENLALKSYNKGYMNAQSKLAAKIEGMTGPKNQLSYSEVTQLTRVPPVSGSNLKIKSSTQVVIISPPEGTKIEKDTTEKLKAEVMKLIDPVKEKIKIKAVRKRDNGKLCIETASADDANKILDSQELKKQGIGATKFGLQNPRLLVFDIPSNFGEEDIIKNVFEQNECMLDGLEQEEFKRGFVPKFRTGKKDSDLSNWVIESSPRIRNILRSKGNERIYIGWQSCKVQDYRGISRCFKCLRFGHISKFCKSEDTICSYCAEKGHNGKNCPNKAKKPVCCNCKAATRTFEHEAIDKSCPAYKLALDRIIARTNYGIT